MGPDRTGQDRTSIARLPPSQYCDGVQDLSSAVPMKGRCPSCPRRASLRSVEADPVAIQLDTPGQAIPARVHSLRASPARACSIAVQSLFCAQRRKKCHLTR